MAKTASVVQSCQRSVAELQDRCRGLAAETVLRIVVRQRFAGQAAVVSSFGAESAVLLSMIADIDRSVPVLFLDTLRHFPETLEYRDQLIAVLGLENVVNLQPCCLSVREHDPYGDLAERNPDRCCMMRKTIPMLRAIDDYRCVITGRKRFQAETREALPVFEAQGRWVKVNPLANWSMADLEAYMEDNRLPRHPLQADGYYSIGCEPCTKPVAPSEHNRAGRWPGSTKTECGIHLPRHL